MWKVCKRRTDTHLSPRFGRGTQGSESPGWGRREASVSMPPVQSTEGGPGIVWAGCRTCNPLGRFPDRRASISPRWDPVA